MGREDKPTAGWDFDTSAPLNCDDPSSFRPKLRLLKWRKQPPTSSNPVEDSSKSRPGWNSEVDNPIGSLLSEYSSLEEPSLPAPQPQRASGRRPPRAAQPLPEWNNDFTEGGMFDEPPPLPKRASRRPRPTGAQRSQSESRRASTPEADETTERAAVSHRASQQRVQRPPQHAE